MVPHTLKIEAHPSAKLRKVGKKYYIQVLARPTGLMVSEAASVVWECCSKGFTYLDIVDYIKRHLPDEYEADIRRNVADCLLDFYDRNLIHWQDWRIVRKDYELPAHPVAGFPSSKARRLVEYCLGDYAGQKIPACTGNLEYGKRPKAGRLFQVSGNTARSSALTKDPETVVLDQKRIAEAWISQGSMLPDKFRCWIVVGDGSGDSSNPSEGVHVGMVRRPNRRHVILVPSSNRGRLLGPLLSSQMDRLKESWTPWEEKSDTVFWGGAATGGGPGRGSSEVLSRFRVLEYFRDNPHPSVHLHLVNDGWDTHSGLGNFRREYAYSHKCLLLLKGNDIPSGLTWFFSGNSVVLMQPPTLECIIHFELEPWVHYVPVTSDPADVVVKLEWVLNNQHKAREIVDNAHEHLRWLYGPEYLWACNEVIRRIARDTSEN